MTTRNPASITRPSTLTRRAFVAAALAGLAQACTENQPGTTGDDKPLIPGYAVDCTPDITDDPLVCITQNDWECTHYDYYVRESICADLLGGTPSEYDGKPELAKYDPDGDGPKSGYTSLDCDDLPKGVLSGYQSLDSCDDCRVCGNQIGGFNNNQGQGGGWDELAFCPETNEELAAEGSVCNPSDSGGEPTTSVGDGPDSGDSGVWMCIGSETIVGTMTETFPFVTSQEISMTLGGPDCIPSTDVTSAQNGCWALCNWKNKKRIEEAQNSGTKIWDPEFDCDSLYGYVPVEVDDPSQCGGGGPMPVPEPAPFTGDAALSFADATATSDQLEGWMSFTIEACAGGPGACAVSIDDLRSNAASIEGVYTAGRGKHIPFTVESPEVKLLQPVAGTIDPATGIVTFPGQDFFVTVSTGTTHLDGYPLGAELDRELFVIEGATGVWDGRELTLNLDWRAREVALALSISGG